MYVCIYIYIYIVCIYIHIHTYIHTYMSIYTYTYQYTHAHISRRAARHAEQRTGSASCLSKSYFRIRHELYSSGSRTQPAWLGHYAPDGKFAGENPHKGLSVCVCVFLCAFSLSLSLY